MCNASLGEQLAPLVSSSAKPKTKTVAKAKPNPAKKPERKAAQKTKPVVEPVTEKVVPKAVKAPAAKATPRKPMEPILKMIFQDKARIELPVTDRIPAMKGDTPIYIDYRHRSAKDSDKGFWLRVYGSPADLNMLMTSRTPIVMDGAIDIFMSSATFENVVYGCLVIGPCKPLIEITWHDNTSSMALSELCDWIKMVPGNGALEFSEIDERVQQQLAA